MSRSSKKGPFVQERLMKRVLATRPNSEAIKTWSRASVITPDFINKSFLVHDGRKFAKVYVVEDMVGHKLGEFAPTRTFKGHAGKEKKEGAAAPAPAPAPAGKK